MHLKTLLILGILTGLTFSVQASTVVAPDSLAPLRKIAVPDGFSPNGDGWNETLDFKAQEWKNNSGEVFQVTITKVSISNREGKVVYESTDSGMTWDGKNGGNPCPQGSYYWNVTFSGYGIEEYTESGVVLLIR